jgi:hypothetical protein
MFANPGQGCHKESSTKGLSWCKDVRKEDKFQIWCDVNGQCTEAGMSVFITLEIKNLNDCRL